MTLASFIKTIFVRFHDLILYGIIGCLSSGLDFCVYTFLVRIIGMNYLLANCISVVVGITTSFTLNRKYNFKVTDRTFRRFAIFFTVGICGMLLSNLILYVCIDKLMMDSIVSKLLSIVFVVLIQFLINKFVTFKKINEDE